MTEFRAQWEAASQQLEGLLRSAASPLPPELLTEAFLLYRGRPDRQQRRQLDALFREMGRTDLAESKLRLARAPLGPGGPKVSAQIEAVRALGLDFKQVAWRVSAGHFILTDEAFTTAERSAYLRWVLGVFDGRLKLNSMKLAELPPEVLSCQGLRTLQFNRNPIKTLPPELFKLESLERLELEHGRFQELPAAVGQLRSLETLRLEGSRLRSLPPELGACTRLRHLSLTDTRLTALPESLGQLHELESLILVGTRIETLPDAILALPRLSALNINGTPMAKDPAQRARVAQRPGASSV